MKLSKLYSNKPFRNITFITDKGGFNVVTGDANEKRKENSHNLGKSKLGELLNFMLLKDHKGMFFYSKATTKEKFLNKGYDFYLEILLNDGKYLTIKRCLDKPTKISFKLNNKKSDGYVLYETFDKSPTSLLKAKSYLNEQLNFDFCSETKEDYRKLVNYSLRTQGDYDPKSNTIFQLKKFIRNKDKDWKPLLFSLLGFDGNLLKKKYKIEELIKQSKKTIKEEEKDFGIKSEEKDLLVGKIQHAENERKNVTQQIETLNFYQQDKETIKELVGTIEDDIALLNSKLYNIEYDIKKLNESIQNEFAFDLDRVKNLFEEVDIHFPKQLSKSYKQLVKFNHQITDERNVQILETLKEKKEEEKQINEELLKENNKREQYRDLIQDTSLFKKLMQHQRKLVSIEKELSRYDAQIEAIEKIETKKSQIERKKTNELQDAKNDLKIVLDNTASNELYMNIRKSFSEIVKYIFNETALITISPNSTYNIDFKPNFPQSAKDEGNTYYKILCLAFDLAILINYRDESYFRFVYHDDVVAGDDNGIKTRLIESIKHVCVKYDIQYILTVVKDNIPLTIDLQENIILELHGNSDEGLLFKMNF